MKKTPIELHNLKNPNKIVKHRKGRGISQGKGKTSGRGQKGQKARSTVRPGFEGGQTPLYRRIPKFGFKNFTRKEYVIVNLDTLSEKYNKGETVSFKTLIEKGIVKSKKNKQIKILGRGKLTKNLKFDVAKITKSAQNQINNIK